MARNTNPMRQISATLPEHQIEWLKARAAEKGISMIEYLRRILDQMIDAEADDKLLGRAL